MIWQTAVTLVFPGFAQGLAGRTNRMIAWLVPVFALMIATAWLTSCVWLLLFVHLASAIDAIVVLRGRDRSAEKQWMLGLIAIGATVGGAVVVGEICVRAFRIPSSSSMPTLQIGDHVLVNTLARDPHRGDLIVFDYPCDPSRQYISRVVALGGESVELRCNELYIDGKKIDDTPVAGDCHYDDFDEDRGEWMEPQPCSLFRETLGTHTFDTMYREHRTNEPLGNFPRADVPPSCANGGEAIGTIAGSAGSDECVPQIRYVVPAGYVFVMGDHRDNANDSRAWGALSVDHVIGRVSGIWLSSGRHGVSSSRIGGVE
ncbi:MAG TPA: signal peptidase I [Kofleriaceae bacterium]